MNQGSLLTSYEYFFLVYKFTSYICHLIHITFYFTDINKAMLQEDGSLVNKFILKLALFYFFSY